MLNAILNQLEIIDAPSALKAISVVISILIMLGAALGISFPDIKGVSSDTAVVTRVVDGDTIVISTGEKVRLIGIDAPESTNRTDCYGPEASEALTSLLTGQMIGLQADKSETDRYDRLLRYVFLDDLFVNHWLVEQGFAIAKAYPPDIAYQDSFTRAEAVAQEQARGLWQACIEAE